MNFGTIDCVILFGGLYALERVAHQLLRQARLKVLVYTCQRQLEEPLRPDGTTLGQLLADFGATVVATDDLDNSDIRTHVTPTTIGIGFSEPWSFPQDIIDLFEGRLLDLMGIRLPHQRGAAHYSWQILRGDKTGGCNLQLVNELAVQGEYDSGALVMSRTYLFPANARKPIDYFMHACTEETRLVLDFLAEVQNGAEFTPRNVQDEFSLFFPRLRTDRDGFIDWTWSAPEIERFICAFDDPYPGARSFLNGDAVVLKDCHCEAADGAFHPFQAGIVYKIADGALHIAARGGSLVVRTVQDTQGACMLGRLRVGQRLASFPARASLGEREHMRGHP